MVTAMHGHGRATALHSLFLKYLGRTRGVQKCGATPHGSRLSRDALLLALQQSHDAVDVDGKARPSLALVAVEVCLALGDNALGVAIDDAPERLVVGRALGPEAALVGLGYGEHLDVVDAVAAAGRVVGRGGNAKYWSLGTLGAMLERSGTAKSLRFPRKRSLTTTMQGRLCLSMGSRSPSTRSKKSWGWIRSSSVTPPSYEAGPASLQAPTGGRYSTPCGTPSPTEVKRTRKPYSESRGFRRVVYTTKGRFQCA